MPANLKQPTLTLTLNAKAVTTPAVTLADLVAEQGHGGSKIATAVNGTFVAASARATTRLAGGDRVEIVSPRQGG